MELIPILSLIILVATISTFIMAISAYVMYKIRESKGRIANSPAQATYEAELIAPAEQLQPTLTQSGYQQAYPTQYQQPAMPYPQQQYQQPQPASLQPTERAYGVKATRFTQAPGQNASRMTQQPPVYRQTTEGNMPADKKFMKYTSEGYVPIQKKKTGENLRWR
jgi:hypothetical protein